MRSGDYAGQYKRRHSADTTSYEKLAFPDTAV